MATQPRHGKGLKGYTPTGGTCNIVSYTESVGGGAKNLTQAQMDAYQRAKLIASPKNQGNWDKAKQILEGAGFEVFWS